MGDKRVGGLRGLDPAVTEWQKTAATNTAALTSKQRKDRGRVRVKYDLPEELKERIEAAAKAEGTSASQIAAFFLNYAMGEYEGGQGNELSSLLFDSKEPSRSMRFQWNLRLPGE